MPIPTISSFPDVGIPGTDSFNTDAVTYFNHLKNTFTAEMNAAIAAINAQSSFGANTYFIDNTDSPVDLEAESIYLCDTSIASITGNLPASPNSGDRIILIDQKGTFGTNAFTVGRNGNNINGSASDVTLELTSMRVELIYDTSYGWTAVAG